MSRRLFVLATYDPATGIASRPAGVLCIEKGPEGWGHYASFVAYEEGADVWRERLATASAPIDEAVAAWEEAADGIAVALEELPPPAIEGPETGRITAEDALAPDAASRAGISLATAVELVVDELLALRARLHMGGLEA